MVTKSAAFYDFITGFDLPAYVSGCVPSSAKEPYITYEPAIGGWLESISVPVSIWYRTESEAKINATVEKMLSFLGIGGCAYSCKGGLLWITGGEPFCTQIPTAEEGLKGKLINVNIEFHTL